jgi:hypothetical protein
VLATESNGKTRPWAWITLAVVGLLVLSVVCWPRRPGTDSSEDNPVHSDILTGDNPFLADLNAGDTLYQYLYANDPSWEDAAMIGRIYIRGGVVPVQDWRQIGRWPVAGVDTVWVWVVSYRAGTSGRNGQGIVKFLLSDPEWGLAIESNQSRPSPRMGAVWERVTSPSVVVGKAFGYLRK